MFFQHNFCNYEVMSALPAPSRWNSVVRKRSRSHKCNAGRAVGPSPGWNLWNQNASNGHINKWNSMKFKHIRQPFVPIYPANYILLYIYMSCYIKLYAIFLYFFLSRVAEILARKFAEMFDSDQDVKTLVASDKWRPCYHAGDSASENHLSSLSHVPYRRGTSITSLLLFIGRTGWSVFRSSLRWCNLSPWQVGLRARTLDMPSL